MKIRSVILTFYLAVFLAAGLICRQRRRRIDMRPIRRMELARYMGLWHEIARYELPFDRRLDDIETRYTLRSDGRIEAHTTGTDLRNGRRGTIRHEIYRTTPNGRLRVTVFGFFHTDYRILELDDAYQWALVGSSMPLRLHILAREPHLNRATFRHIVSLAERRGYTLDRLRLLQTPQ